MPGRTRLYHARHAPAGQDFEVDGRMLKAYETQGWVDDPGKAGINPWGGDTAAEVASKHIENQEERLGGIASGFDNGDGVRCTIWHTIAADVTLDVCELVILNSLQA